MTERLEEILNDLPISIRHSGELESLKKYAREQAERVRELENENRILRTVAESNKYIGEQYLEQNKRYREALNSIMTLWKYSEDRTDFEWLAHKMSDEARKALEGGNND